MYSVYVMKIFLGYFCNEIITYGMKYLCIRKNRMFLYYFELFFIQAEQIKQETVVMKDVFVECIKNNDLISENWFNVGFQFIISLVILKEDKC